jgi:hypothetical protein
VTQVADRFRVAYDENVGALEGGRAAFVVQLEVGVQGRNSNRQPCPLSRPSGHAWGMARAENAAFGSL